MDIRDVSYLALVDTKKDVLYALNPSSIDPAPLLSTISSETDPISLYEDRVLLLARQKDVIVLLLGMPDSNEIFLQNAFDNLLLSLDKLLKKWSAERVGEKYDQVVLLLNEFVFRGVILTDDTNELNGKTVKRSFETINGVKMTKGFAFFLNKATKSLTGR